MALPDEQALLDALTEAFAYIDLPEGLRTALLSWLQPGGLLVEQRTRFHLWRLVLEHAPSNRVLAPEMLVLFWHQLGRDITMPGSARKIPFAFIYDPELSSGLRSDCACPKMPPLPLVRVVFTGQLSKIIDAMKGGYGNRTHREVERTRQVIEWYQLFRDEEGFVYLEEDVLDAEGPDQEWVSIWTDEMARLWRQLEEARASMGSELVDAQAGRILDFLGLPSEYNGCTLFLELLSPAHPGLRLHCPTVFDVGISNTTFVPHRDDQHWNRAYDFRSFKPSTAEALRDPIDHLRAGQVGYGAIDTCSARPGCPSLAEKEIRLRSLWRSVT